VVLWDGTPQVTPKSYAMKLALFVVAVVVIFIWPVLAALTRGSRL
jgi:hypothetical protein